MGKEGVVFANLEPYVLDAEVVANHDFQISGDFAQQLEVTVAPGETLSAEPGSFVMCSRGIKPSTDVGGAKQGCTRLLCAGESLFRLNFENFSEESQMVALAPPGPGTVIPLDLSKCSGIVVKGEAFLAAMGKDWEIKLHTVKNVGTALFGGQGIFLTELHGSGMGFISGVGYISTLELQEGEQMTVDTEVLLAFEHTVDFDVEYVGSILTCCCGGMGATNSVLTGPGKVYLQSLPIKKLARTLQRYMISGGGGGGGGGDGGGGGGGGE